MDEGSGGDYQGVCNEFGGGQVRSDDDYETELDDKEELKGGMLNYSREKLEEIAMKLLQ